jgi:hypothetical protein
MKMPELSLRELATVLAALRFWQEEMCPDPAGCYPEHFEGTTPLDAREIDDLCERLNRGGT